MSKKRRKSARTAVKRSVRPRPTKGAGVVAKKAAIPSGMRKVAAAAVRRNFAGTIDAVRMTRERLVIDRHGTSVAAIVPIEDAELLDALENADDVHVARKRLRAIREGRSSTIAAEDLYKKLGL